MVYRDAEHRYHHDPAYRAVVEMMVGVLLEMHLTPGELRDAAMLAAIKFESERQRPWLIEQLVPNMHKERI